MQKGKWITRYLLARILNELVHLPQARHLLVVIDAACSREEVPRSHTWENKGHRFNSRPFQISGSTRHGWSCLADKGLPYFYQPTWQFL
jgi:hypothetical protein